MIILYNLHIVICHLPYFIKSSLSIFVPKPDLIICFKSDAKTLYSRKQEETLDELQELVVLYNDYITKNKKIMLVDANQSKEEVLLQILNLLNIIMKNNKILVSAYSCEPNRGSEPGVGWTYVKEMSKYFDLIVLTRVDKRQIIEKQFKKCRISFY